MNSTDYEPWMFQTTAVYGDSWLTEALARDAEALTRALQKTISGDTNTNNTNTTNNNSDAFITSSDAVSSFCKAETQSASGVSGSDPEMVVTASRRRVVLKTAAAATTGGVVTKKITKRKTRATKKCQTTVIMADPANFRHMVQQVTGVRFDTLQQQQSMSQTLSRNQMIVKPEPKRLTGTGLSLPTLDTSSFFVDHTLISQQEHGGVGFGAGVGAFGGQREGCMTGCDDGVQQMAYGDSLIGSDGAGYGYESYQSFPTLESWK